MHAESRVMNVLCTNMLLTGFTAQQKPIATHIAKDVITAYSPKSSRLRWWCGVTAAASIFAVAGMVGQFPSISRIVTEPSPRGFLPTTRSFLAGSDVETTQQPTKTVSLPSASTLSALPRRSKLPPVSSTDGDTHAV